MSSFLKEVAQEVCKGQDNLEHHLFVLPSKRAGNFLKTCLAKEMGKTIFAPEVYGIEEFVEKVSGQASASKISLLFTLYEAYLDITPNDPEPYESFTQWGNTLLQDFMEIDRYLVPPEKVFSYLSAVQEMNHWAVAPEKTTMVQNYLDFWEQLHPLYSRFSEKLTEKGEGHQGLLYKQAVQKLPAYLQKTKEKRFVFAGFNALNTAESRIIQQILQEADADIFWDSDPYFIEDDIHDAGLFIREYFAHWPYYNARPPKGPRANFIQQKKIRIVGVPKQVSQAKYVGNILREMQLNASGELDNTALILGDEKLLNPILNALPSSLSPVNITMGYPLGETTIAGLFLQWMDLFISQDREGWYFQYFTEFLVHPEIQLLFTGSGENEATLIREKVITNNSLFIRIEDLNRLGLKNKEIIEILFSEKRDPIKFLQDGQALLKVLRNRKEADTDPITVQESVLLSQVLQELDKMLQLFPYIKDIKALKGLFLEQLRTKNLDFIGSPSQGLQIMGMLESRNLDFDTVIITSVNEGILPAGKTVNSFIPFDIKREMGLPTYKEKDAVYTYHFYRILQRAKNIILCYNTEPDVLEGGEKSRLIYQLTTDPNIASYISEEIATPRVPLKKKSPLLIPKDDWVLEKISELAKRGFSPTALTDYIRDPLVFFKKHILNVDDPEEVEESLEARTFGILIHQALESLYSPLLEQVLTPEALGAQKKKIKPLIVKLVSELYPGQTALKGKNLIACEVIIKYLQRFLDLEIEQSKGHTIRLLALEKRIKQEYPISGIKKQITLKGTVDRVDEFDGQVRILDYKTGSVKATEVEIASWDSLIQEKDKNKAFQLLCYALLYSREREVEPLQAGIISIKSPQGGPVRFAIKPAPRSKAKDPVISQEVLQQFEVQLQALIKEICDPNIPFTEKPD